MGSKQETRDRLSLIEANVDVWPQELVGALWMDFPFQ